MSENRLEIVLQEYKKLCAKFKQPTRSRIINGLEDAIKSGKTQIDAFNLSTPGLKDIKKLYDKDVSFSYIRVLFFSLVCVGSTSKNNTLIVI